MRLPPTSAPAGSAPRVARRCSTAPPTPSRSPSPGATPTGSRPRRAAGCDRSAAAARPPATSSGARCPVALTRRTRGRRRPSRRDNARGRSTATAPAAIQNAGPDQLARGIVVTPGAEVPRRGSAQSGWSSTRRSSPIPIAPSPSCSPAPPPTGGWCSSWRCRSATLLVRPRPSRRTSSARSSGSGSTCCITSCGRTRSTPPVRSRGGTSPTRPPRSAPAWSRPARVMATSSCPMAPAAWIDGGPPRRTQPIAGLAVVPAVSIEHGSLVPPLEHPAPPQQLAPDQLAAVTHPGAAARIIAPAGCGKTRVLTERARHLLRRWRVPPAALQPRGVQQAGPGGDAGAHHRPARAAGPHAQRDRAGHRQRHRRRSAPSPRSLRTIDELQVRDACIGRLVQFPRQRNTDPVAAWIEALERRPPRPAQPDARRGEYGGDVDGLAEVWPAYRAALAARRRRSTSTSRSTAPSSCCSTDADVARRRPARRAGCCSSTSSRTSRPPTCCWSGCSPAPRSACSGSATTTRRSTATPAPTRPG